MVLVVMIVQLRCTAHFPEPTLNPNLPNPKLEIHVGSRAEGLNLMVKD